jgi:hypothetical protein
VFATIAASEVSMASLSKILGHCRMATTSDLYAHLYEPDAVKATEAVSSVFGRLQSVLTTQVSSALSSNG